MLTRGLVEEFAYDARAGVSLEIRGILPMDYLKVLRVVDGFITKDRRFRLFGTRQTGQLPSVFEWNQAPWRNAYGHLLADVLIVAEDVFGDQYGYELDRGNTGAFIKFFCEGAERIGLSPGTLEEFLVQKVLVTSPTAYDHDLAVRAAKRGLLPLETEHLAFELPLLTNGEYAETNLKIESPSLHLGVLGQLSNQVAGKDEGAPIRRFGS